VLFNLKLHKWFTDLRTKKQKIEIKDSNDIYICTGVSLTASHLQAGALPFEPLQQPVFVGYFQDSIMKYLPRAGFEPQSS
jgi:hypothetical protein